MCELTECTSDNEVKVTAGMFAPATDLSPGRDLSVSISVRTRKMVNYACEGLSQGKL